MSQKSCLNVSFFLLLKKKLLNRCCKSSPIDHVFCSLFYIYLQTVRFSLNSFFFMVFRSSYYPKWKIYTRMTDKIKLAFQKSPNSTGKRKFIPTLVLIYIWFPVFRYLGLPTSFISNAWGFFYVKLNRCKQLTQSLRGNEGNNKINKMIGWRC